MPTLYCFFKWLPPFFLCQCRIHISDIAVVNAEVTNPLSAQFFGFSNLNAVYQFKENGFIQLGNLCVYWWN